MARILSLDKIKDIGQNSPMLREVHDCVGLTLEDVCKAVEFTEPIKIRNIKAR